MTELGAKAWRGYAPIDWARLARAQAFFEARGYEYVEVPWAVQQTIVEATTPPGATPISVQGADAVLVGSAEQGFLQIRTRLFPGNLYFSISPCFRGETKVIRGHTQLCFMKLELFAPSRQYDVEETCLFLVEDATHFMTTEGAHLTRIATEAGFDLQCSGVEVGSYGVRSFQDVHWAYATGVAEPRFSFALEAQRLQRKRWDQHREDVQRGRACSRNREPE